MAFNYLSLLPKNKNKNQQQNSENVSIETPESLSLPLPRSPHGLGATDAEICVLGLESRAIKGSFVSQEKVLGKYVCPCFACCQNFCRSNVCLFNKKKNKKNQLVPPPPQAPLQTCINVPGVMNSGSNFACDLVISITSIS